MSCDRESAASQKVSCTANSHKYVQVVCVTGGSTTAAHNCGLRHGEGWGCRAPPLEQQLRTGQGC
eukprot:2204940-Prymnesium_polylepis.2